MARQKVSERTFVDADGVEVERMEQATGARYTLAGIGKSFDKQFGEPATESTMYAIFGFWTKIGNVANTVLNDKDEPGTQEDAAEAIEEFVAQTANGVWREVGEGAGRGPKYDNEVLALALHATLGEAAKGDPAHYMKRLSADKGYRAKVVSRDDVKAAYWAEQQRRGVAKPVASVEALA